MKVQRLESQIRQSQDEVNSIIGNAQNADRTLTQGELSRLGQLDEAQSRCREELLTIEVGGCQ